MLECWPWPQHHSRNERGKTAFWAEIDDNQQTRLPTVAQLSFSDCLRRATPAGPHCHNSVLIPSPTKSEQIIVVKASRTCFQLGTCNQAKPLTADSRQPVTKKYWRLLYVTSAVLVFQTLTLKNMKCFSSPFWASYPNLLAHKLNALASNVPSRKSAETKQVRQPVADLTSVLTLSLPRVINFKFLCSPTRNITSQKPGFSQLTQMKDDYTTKSHYLTYVFLFKRLGECTFLNLGVEGLNKWRPTDYDMRQT